MNFTSSDDCDMSPEYQVIRSDKWVRPIVCPSWEDAEDVADIMNQKFPGRGYKPRRVFVMDPYR